MQTLHHNNYYKCGESTNIHTSNTSTLMVYQKVTTLKYYFLFCFLFCETNKSYILSTLFSSVCTAVCIHNARACYIPRLHTYIPRLSFSASFLLSSATTKFFTSRSSKNIGNVRRICSENALTNTIYQHFPPRPVSLCSHVISA